MGGSLGAQVQSNPKSRPRWGQLREARYHRAERKNKCIRQRFIQRQNEFSFLPSERSPADIKGEAQGLRERVDDSE